MVGASANRPRHAGSGDDRLSVHLSRHGRWRRLELVPAGCAVLAGAFHPVRAGPGALSDDADLGFALARSRRRASADLQRDRSLAATVRAEVRRAGPAGGEGRRANPPESRIRISWLRASEREVVIPPGTWKGDDGSIVQGPKTLMVRTPLARLPYFERLSASDTARKESK